MGVREFTKVVKVTQPVNGANGLNSAGLGLNPQALSTASGT